MQWPKLRWWWELSRCFISHRATLWDDGWPMAKPRKCWLRCCCFDRVVWWHLEILGVRRENRFLMPPGCRVSQPSSRRRWERTLILFSTIQRGALKTNLNMHELVPQPNIWLCSEEKTQCGIVAHCEWFKPSFAKLVWQCRDRGRQRVNRESWSSWLLRNL